MIIIELAVVLIERNILYLNKILLYLICFYYLVSKVNMVIACCKYYILSTVSLHKIVKNTKIIIIIIHFVSLPPFRGRIAYFPT